MNGNSRDAALMILLGQSNAVGHGLPMAEEDKIKTPLKNVFGLARENNQSFDSQCLCWSGYTGAGMNLGETQDDTWSVANALALEWQAEIDGGNDRLPDLYIVHIAIGAQGVTKEYMWYPEREKKLIPGPLGTADISLYPLTRHILSLVGESLAGRCVKQIGIHWRGGENDITVPIDELKQVLLPIYRTLFSGFREALGVPDCPVILHRLLCGGRADDLDEPGRKGEKRAGMNYINEVFDILAAEDGQCSIFDHSAAPHYRADELRQGIFEQDLVHFTPETNRWAASEILRGFMNQNG